MRIFNKPSKKGRPKKYKEGVFIPIQFEKKEIERLKKQAEKQNLSLSDLIKRDLNTNKQKKENQK